MVLALLLDLLNDCISGLQDLFAVLDLVLNNVLLGSRDGPVEQRGDLAHLGGQVPVTRRQSHAVSLTTGGNGTHGDGQQQITNHGTEDHTLLGILLTEKSTVRLDNVKQLGDNSRDSAEEVGAGDTLHLMGESLDLDKGTTLLGPVKRNAHGIHFADLGEEDRSTCVCRDQGSIVGVEGAGVLVEVFVRGKLGGVDKDRDYDRVALLLSRFYYESENIGKGCE